MISIIYILKYYFTFIEEFENPECDISNIALSSPNIFGFLKYLWFHKNFNVFFSEQYFDKDWIELIALGSITIITI